MAEESPGQLAAAIRRLWTISLERERGTNEEPVGHWASNIGHPCLYFLWAAFARWKDRVEPDADRLALYDMGHQIEATTKARLARAHFEVLEEQTLIENKELRIRGRIDARLRVRPTGKMFLEEAGIQVPELLTRRRGVLTEIKGLNQADWQSLATLDDMLSSSKPWIIRWPAQLGFYLEESGDEDGIFLFISKITGMPNPLEVSLANPALRDAVAQAKDRIRRVNAYIALGAVPPAIDYDPGLCGRCDFAHICPTWLETRGSGEALSMQRSSRLDANIAEYLDTKPAGTAYRHASDEVRKAFDTAALWPAPGKVRTLLTKGYTLLLEVSAAGRKTWSVQTTRGGLPHGESSSSP